MPTRSICCAMRRAVSVAVALAALSLCFAQESRGRQANAEWQPWHVSLRIQPGSALDVSALLDAPAGNHGFTQPTDRATLQFADGRQARFWGVSLAWEAQAPEADEVEPIVARLAANGINLVRLTYLDYRLPKGPVVSMTTAKTELDPAYMDKLDRLAAAMIDAGIYIDLSLVFGGPIDGLGLPKVQQKTLQIFHPDVVAAHDAFTRALLNHKNPYTGRTWGEEKGVAFVEMYNEGDVFYVRKHLEQVPAKWLEPLDEMWRRWVERRKPELSGPAPQRFDFAVMDSTDPKDRPLRSASLHFMSEIHEARYAALRKIVRECGYRGAICDNAGGSFSAASRYAQRNAEIQIAHNYFDHPTASNYCATTKRTASREGFPNLRISAAERLPGKPIVLGEWDFCYPNPWRAEGVAATAAVAAFQNWAGAIQFTYWSMPWKGHGEILSPQGHIVGIWRVMCDPVVMAQYPAAAMMFLRGDLDPYRETLRRRQYAWQTGWPPGDLRYLCHGMETQVEPDLEGKPSPTVDDLAPVLEADTGQLDYRFEPGLLRIDSPRTQGIVGHPEGCSWRTSDAVMQIDTPFAVALLSSLSDKPIGESERILLTAVGQAENTGTTFPDKPNEGETRYSPLDRGKAPILAQRVRGTVYLRHSGELQVYALAPDGARAKSVEVGRLADGSWRIPLGEADMALHYEIVAAP